MSDDSKRDSLSRRKMLECMTWCGTGVIWTMVGGVPKARALDMLATSGAQPDTGFSFAQISDSHIGFSREANMDTAATLQVAMDKVLTAPVRPSFLLHTGDISHLARAEEFDAAAQIIGGSGLDAHYVPGEHDLVDEDSGKLFRDRYGAGKLGDGWFSFDDHGVHFIGLVNVANLKAGGLGSLGPAQLAWLKEDVRSLSASTPIVVFAHMPLWMAYPAWGWGTDDAAEGIGYLRRFGSVTVLNGHIHQIMQKVEGNVSFHTARATGFLQPAPGTAKGPGPVKAPGGRLKDYLGVTSVELKYVPGSLAITDRTLA